MPRPWSSVNRGEVCSPGSFGGPEEPGGFGAVSRTGRHHSAGGGSLEALAGPGRGASRSSSATERSCPSTQRHVGFSNATGIADDTQDKRAGDWNKPGELERDRLGEAPLRQNAEPAAPQLVPEAASSDACMIGASGVESSPRSNQRGAVRGLATQGHWYFRGGTTPRTPPPVLVVRCSRSAPRTHSCATPRPPR